MRGHGGALQTPDTWLRFPSHLLLSGCVTLSKSLASLSFSTLLRERELLIPVLQHFTGWCKSS